MTRTPFLVGALAFSAWMAGPAQWTPQISPTRERLRGVSAVSATVAWASGNKGTALRTTDGGTSWLSVAPPAAQDLDFRDIEAFDARTAYVLSIGPGDRSRIYRTTDGGARWALVFTNGDPRAFYDAIAFWDRTHGLAFGDPVDGRFTIVRTDDGVTWTPVGREGMPEALPGEGAFAASGTCLVTGGTTRAWFATGGAARTRVFRSADRGSTWQVADTPLVAGTASAGAFSLAFADEQHGMVVGGDYRREGEPSDNLAITGDGGRTWTTGKTRLRAFRSAVAAWPRGKGRAWIAAGPAGADWSDDGGQTWAPVEGEGFHALSVARRGAAAWAVGEQGRIAILRARPLDIFQGRSRDD
jgi:photosystem II stability/assembly factor-like uncharacterized protein